MSSPRLIPDLLTYAWLLPAVGAVGTWLVGRLETNRRVRGAAWFAVATMAASFLLCVIALAIWWSSHLDRPMAGTFYTLGAFGELSIAAQWYIDGLTVLLFAVVTTVALAVHLFAVGYLDDERTDHYEDHEIEHEALDHSTSAPHYTRPGRLPRFFTFLQLFTFSMLGLLLAGNLLQVFAFWELVGACSYFLIGFYFERPAAAAAATKAFVMNRIGDFGFIVGIMILWTAFGRLNFAGELIPVMRMEDGFALMGRDSSLFDMMAAQQTGQEMPAGAWPQPPRPLPVPQWLLVLAGLGIFAGAVGKSAQLPLSTWLPDAMAGPTPVSALVHSATMVAAGVYLVGRLYPVFLPDVLIVIAYVGAATLVYGATCAAVQTDLKRILAYSTVSQLGYMVLACGVGGRDAGLFHLVTHAFFKSLLFLAAGAVIVACGHVQDVRRLGGLRRKLPITAYTALVGVLAIGGLAVPAFDLFGEAIAFSGYHSKDSILASALAFVRLHPEHGLLFALPLATAGLTAFYMFRFWLLAFAGEPRDEDLYRQVGTTSVWLTGPLIALALLAAFCGIGGTEGPLFRLIESSRGGTVPAAWPPEAFIDAHHTASLWGLLAGAGGALLAIGIYGANLMDSQRTVAFLGPTRTFLLDGWRLDLLYRRSVTKPVRLLGFVVALFDRIIIDSLLHALAALTLAVARFDRLIDERLVDGAVQRLADATYAAGVSIREVQSGRLRQYVMTLAAAAVILFALAVILIPK